MPFYQLSCAQFCSAIRVRTACAVDINNCFGKVPDMTTSRIPAVLASVLVLCPATSAANGQYLLSGHVYEGVIGDQSAPLGRVTVTLYGSSHAGELEQPVTSAVTNDAGLYALTVPGQSNYRHYYIVPTAPAGYTFVGAVSLGGTVINNLADPDWIEYVPPFIRKILADNDFWYRRKDLPQDTLAGTVIDADTGAPLAATVTVLQTGGVADTDPATGFYSLLECVGVYTVQAEAPGYSVQTAKVTVVAEDTVIQDFTLSYINQAPIVDAGPDVSLWATELPVSVELAGAATDPDTGPKSLETQWSMVSGPDQVTFAQPAALATTATLHAAGTYVLRLTASDGIEQVFDEVQILVQMDEEPRFIRGDSNADGTVNVADPIFLLDHLFANGAASSCLDAADADDDGAVNIADAITVLQHLFGGPAQIEEPFPDCGVDPTDDLLAPCVYPPCGSSSRKGTDVRFKLSFAAPSVVIGKPGTWVQFDAAVQLVKAAPGVQGWSFGVTTNNPEVCRATDIDLADVIYLADLDFADAQIISRPQRPGEAVVSAVVLSRHNYESRFELPPISPDGDPAILLHLTFQALVPEQGSKTVTLRFAEGLRGKGLPVPNVLVVNGQRIVPALGHFDITVSCADAADANDDGRVDFKDLKAIADQWLSQAPGGGSRGIGGTEALNHDIGSPKKPGSASYDQDADVWTVTGAGKGIWGKSDQFHYAYEPVSGDAQITARVHRIQEGDWLGTAGVMFRETLAPASKHAMMGITAGRGVSLRWRSHSGGASEALRGGPAANMKPPICLGIKRTGNTFKGYYFSDGKWVRHGSVTIPMKKNIFMGLAVTSRDQNELTTARFDTACKVSPADVYDYGNINFMDFAAVAGHWVEIEIVE